MMFRNDQLLSAALLVFGVIFCLIYPLAVVWPAGWAWHTGSPASSEYFMMIVGVYATLGVFLIRAAMKPSDNRSLIWFTVWSSLVHAVVMAVPSLNLDMHHGHLAGDVPALLLVAVVLAFLTKRSDRNRAKNI